MLNLYTRGGRYVYRRILPQDIQGLVERKQVFVSLDTHKKAIANAHATYLNAMFNQAVSLVRLNRDKLDAESMPELFDSQIAMARQSIALTVGTQLIPTFAPINQAQSLEEIPKAPNPYSKRTPKVTEITDTYINHKLRSNNWTKGTENDVRKALSFFVGLVGDKRLGMVTRADCRQFRDSLTKLPRNSNRIVKYKNHSLKALAKMDIPEKDKLSNQRVNIYLKWVAGFFRWAADEYDGKVKADIMSNLLLKEAKTSGYVPFTPSELNTIYSSDYFQSSDKTYKFWLPLLGLYTGARLNELCQLETSDIRLDDAEKVWFIDINNNDNKSLKNDSSIRKIPIHKSLVDLGFLNYVEVLKQINAKKLFPDLVGGIEEGGRSASKAFTLLITKVGVKGSRGKTFHSLRKNAVDALALISEKDSIVSQIVGHSQQGMTFGRYFSEYPLEQVKEAIDLIEYDIPLVELRGRWKSVLE